MARRPTQVETDDDQLTTSWGLVFEATVGISRALDQELAAVEDLSGPWFEVLLRLSRSPDGEMPLSKLAQQVAFSSGGLTKLVDRLAARGLVERIASTVDRRVIQARITPAGNDVLQRALHVHTRVLRRVLLAPLGAERLADIATAMRAVRDQWPQFRES